MKRSVAAKGCTKEKYLLAFLLGFGTILFTVLPMMLTERGYFIYYGDYNAQQIALPMTRQEAADSAGTGSRIWARTSLPHIHSISAAVPFSG